MIATLLCMCATFSHAQADDMSWVQVVRDKKSFVLKPSNKQFTPWGFNDASAREFGPFIDQTKQHAVGWFGFYRGKPPDALLPSTTMPDLVMMGRLEYFQKTASESNEPVTFEFKRKCGPARGRKDAFDPKTQTYYLHVEDIARFEIRAVTADLALRPVVLKITGMLDRPEGPLTLFVPDKGAKNKEFKLYHHGYDKENFRIERKDGMTTIEFMAQGKALLSPGVWFQYVDFYRN